MTRPPRRSIFSAFRRGSGEPAKEPGPLGEGGRVDHYAILERVGAGGMGVIYRAHDTKLDRTVALKFLPPHLDADEDARRRLIVEARAAAGLDHPNICTIHDVGSHEGRSYIAMAHYEGRTLKERLAETGPVSPIEAARILAAVARGLHRAHEAGIVHRDIKPGNIFLTDQGTVKILDFGIAKMSGVELTAEGAQLGTVAYMAPEQLRGTGVDARTDVWALGVVLFEACTGERPFPGTDVVSMMGGILELDAARLDATLPSVPGALADLVEACLRKDPRERPDTAAEIADALLACAEAGPDVDSPGDAPAAPTREEDRAPRISAEGERRQATVLECEVSGRGALAEWLSPEASDELTQACRTAIRTIVEEHGGIVNADSGEHVQALFGIPGAREDDAVRAVRAARAVCAAVEDLVAQAGVEGRAGLRCAVDTGRVVARLDDTTASGIRVVGGPVERSARIAALAKTGQVLVSRDCRRLIAPFFECEEAGELPGRGDDARAPTYRVGEETGARTRIEASAAEDLTALSGREAELTMLLQACEATAAGQGRFVSIVGEAGVGKSRLLFEFDRRVDAARFDILRGRCQSFGGEIPYLPFIDLLWQRLGFTPGDDRASTDEVERRVRDISPELADFLPFYLQLLSLVEEEDRTLHEAVAGEQLRVGLVESLAAMLTLGSRDRPTVVLLEDWHWVDAGSRQVLRQLLEMASAYPLLIIVTTRPEGDGDWGSPAAHTPIVLGPLTIEDSESIVRFVLEAEDVPRSLSRFLHERTGGNPFFLEEVCRSLLEEDTLRTEEDGRVAVAGSLDRLELPDTVQGVLRARLDRLDETERRLIRTASVIGREFGQDVLAHALGDAGELVHGLDDLRELGLIQRIRVVPSPIYRFKHALTQDAAYDGLLERQRAEIHGRVGEAIETLQPDRLADQLDRLAEHFARAARWEKAVEYGIAATDRLWGVSGFQEAADMQARTLEWAARLEDPDSRFEKRIELLLRQERLFEFLGERDRQQMIIDELLETLDPATHSEHVASALVRQGDLLILTRDHEGAERALETAIGLAEDAGSESVRRHALRSMGLLRWHQSRHRDAVDLVEQALEIDRRMENDEAIIGNLANLGQLYRALGDHQRALESLEQALEIERSIERRRSGLIQKESYILHVMGSIYSSLGDDERALEALEEARATTRTGTSEINVVQEHFHLTAIARLYLKDGRVEEALDLYREAVRLNRKSRHLEGLSHSVRLLGDVLLNLDRHEEALPYLEEATEVYATLHDPASEGPMWRNVAVAREALGDLVGAREAWGRARDLAVRIEDGALELEATEQTARLLRTSDPAAALRTYRSALELAEARGSIARAGGFRYAIGLLHWEFGAYEEALENFESAYRALKEGGDMVHAGLALNSAGRTLRDLDRHEEAVTRLEEAIAVNRDSGERLLEAHARATLGDVYLDLDRPAEAVEQLTAAHDLREELGDETGRGWMLCRLAAAQRALGSPAGVVYYLDEAEEIAGRSGDVELARACAAERRARVESEED